ncbi:hypothetical protein FRC07_006824 [Ceratobasidium sp. 392]|nr:hypothetical protein FRC07_006824 [Ceratobasidium sp. 392]
MAAVVGLLDTHLGDQTAGQATPGSLFFHNSILKRKAFTPTSLPSFAIAKDLIMDSLAACIIHCLLRVSDCKNLESYLAHLKSHHPTAPASMSKCESSWSRLLNNAKKLYSTYVDTATASNLQSDRIYANPEAKVGDMVYEGAVFFLRDALNLEELFDAVKCGHSGRILSVLKLFALSFRGASNFLDQNKMRDMLKLIESLEKYEVYEIKERRTFDDKCKPVVDAQSLGLEGPDIAHTVPHTEFPRYPSSTAVGQSSSTNLAPETGLGPDPMETDWTSNEPERGKESEDGLESEPEGEEHSDAMLPLENEDDISLEVNAADMWDIICDLEGEDEFEWDGDKTA